MQNNYIASIVALFFLGKNSKKRIEKILNASWHRTVIYGALTAIVSIFFYKTYQVASIYNYVQIYGVEQSYDKNGNLLDTITDFKIYNIFGNVPTHRDIYKGFGSNSDEYEFGDLDSAYLERGGVRIVLQAYTHPDTFIKRKIEGMTDYDEIKISEYFAEHNIPYHNIDHLYQISYLATSLPTLIPFYPIYDNVDPLKLKESHVFMEFQLSNSRNNPNVGFTKSRKFGDYNIPSEELFHPKILDNGFFFCSIMGTLNIKEIDKKYVRLCFSGGGNVINDLNIFTAADISQYNYVISLQSNCPVKNIIIEYDIPVETDLVSENIKTFTRGFVLDSVMVKDLMNSSDMMFHIKIPSLSNLQLIRSLFLTTLLTALVSLFIKNLYYLLCKLAYRQRKKNRIPYCEAKKLSPKLRKKTKYRVKVIKRLLKFISLVIIGAFLTLAGIVFYDTSILLPVDYFSYKMIIYIIIFVIALIILTTYLAYRYVRKPIANALTGVQEEDDSEEKDDNFTIFVHERDEDSEYDKLVEEMYNDNPEDIQINEDIKEEEKIIEGEELHHG